jgi:tRNA(Ile)-lysidine synthase
MPKRFHYKKNIIPFCLKVSSCAMQQEFIRYLKDNCLCPVNSKFLLAVSGGIDSVVMAWLFYNSEIDFSIAHCNFHLRGEESDGDQRFVKELASKLNKPCFIRSFDVHATTEEYGISVQMAARELRYAWFHELADQHNFDFIAIAHNRNDVVETVLLNFARGCGIRGLTGIKPQSGKIIRPLLFALRHTINIYADEHKISWREDSSNAHTRYIRNRVRHKIIPEFETLNPSFIHSACDTIDRLEQNEQLLDYIVNQVKAKVWQQMADRIRIDFRKLMEYPAAETLLFELLKEFGCSRLNMKSVVNTFESISGKQFITQTHCITRDRTHLIVTRHTLPIDGIFEINPETAFIDYPVNLFFKVIKKADDFNIPVERNYAALDADAVIYPLVLRKWHKGDRFKPLGLKGSKKVSDFLINNKVLLPDKQNIWVLETAGKIVWIIDHRIDDRFKITDQTKNILFIEHKIIQEQ